MKTLFLNDDECALLREMLDFVPLSVRYIAFVADLLQRIPESAVADTPPGNADSAPAAVHSSPTAGGFSLTAREPHTIAVLHSVMSRLPHGEDSL